MTELKQKSFNTSSGIPIESVFATAESLENHLENDLHYGKFYISGLQKGQGLTVANTIRRILLYDLQGIGITHAKFLNACSSTPQTHSKESSKIYHEFSTISGMRESILELLMNLRLIVWAKESSIEVKKIQSPIKGEISFKSLLTSEEILADAEKNKNTIFILKAKHFNIQKSGVFIVNPNQYLATLVLPIKRRPLPIDFVDTKSIGSANQNPQSEENFQSELNELLNLTIEYIIGSGTGQEDQGKNETEKRIPFRNDSREFQSGDRSTGAGLEEFEDYSTYSSNSGNKAQNNFLRTGGNFFPVKKVNYSIQNFYETSGTLTKTQLPRTYDEISKERGLNLNSDQKGPSQRGHEDVFLEIWTNGSITPQESLTQTLEFFIQLFKELRFSLNN